MEMRHATEWVNLPYERWKYFYGISHLISTRENFFQSFAVILLRGHLHLHSKYTSVIQQEVRRAAIHPRTLAHSGTRAFLDTEITTSVFSVCLV
ncbi:hypothetical protein E2C01_045986 [Portunus trituberculatus]|uniref:Uncharacterized protein n=1 Tax=Portunus trituberculatus TaxID=210409 RepID=A0A5B7G3V1_PORTR|nr:hypothetical protein [Portunus trituberculatus]